MAVERLLLETGDYLLLESGDRLLLESSTGAADVLCTLALTDATDTVTASATVAIVATLAKTDATDPLLAAATITQPEAAEVVSLGGRDKLEQWLRYDDTRTWPVLVKASMRDEDDRMASAATMGAGPVWAGLSLVDGNDTLRAGYRIDWPAATLRRSTPRAKLIRT